VNLLPHRQPHRLGCITTPAPSGGQRPDSPTTAGLDLGPGVPQTVASRAQLKTILWNGPMGVFRLPHLRLLAARAIADATRSQERLPASSAAATRPRAVRHIGFADRVSYISTGGGRCWRYMGRRELCPCSGAGVKVKW
jgi:phosphoglycerate kinase